jgi:hypothetical protein
MPVSVRIRKHEAVPLTGSYEVCFEITVTLLDCTLLARAA